MTLTIYESFKINTNTTTTTGTIGTLKPEKEPTEAYRILLVITEAPEGTTHEEALRRAGTCFNLVRISAEPECRMECGSKWIRIQAYTGHGLTSKERNGT